MPAQLPIREPSDPDSIRAAKQPNKAAKPIATAKTAVTQYFQIPCGFGGLSPTQGNLAHGVR